MGETPRADFRKLWMLSSMNSALKASYDPHCILSSILGMNQKSSGGLTF